MRKSIACRVVIVALALCAVAASGFDTPSEARRRPSRARKQFEANKGFGLGLMFGAPTGLSGKYYLSDDTALDFGLGAYYRYRYHSALHIHMDFLWHPVVLASPDPFELPLYFGVGGRILQHDRYRNDYDDHIHLGVRAPIGIAMDFNDVPLDIFFELAFVFDFLVDHSDHAYFDFGGAIGIRYYFN